MFAAQHIEVLDIYHYYFDDNLPMFNQIPLDISGSMTFLFLLHINYKSVRILSGVGTATRVFGMSFTSKVLCMVVFSLSALSFFSYLQDFLAHSLISLED